MSQLFPEGITKLDDLPYTHFDAILTGLQFLAFEELIKEERPPRDIWMEPKKLKEHFDLVERRRKAKYGGDDGDIRDVPIDGPVEQNDVMKELGLV